MFLWLTTIERNGCAKSNLTMLLNLKIWEFEKMKSSCNDTHPDIERIHIQFLREAGPARRFELACSLSRSVIEMSRGAIQKRHPEMTPREVALKQLALCHGEDLAQRVAQYLKDRHIS